MIAATIFLAAMLLPGLLLVNLLRLHRGRSIAEVLGFGFGLSVGVTTLLLLATTTFSGSVKAIHVWGLIAASALGLVLPLIRSLRHLNGSFPKVGLHDLLVVVLTVVHFGTLSSQFIEYPIFPRWLSGDFSNHLEKSLAFLNGTQLPTQATYPPAVHLIIAAGLTVLGGEPFVAMQQTMLLVASMAPLLIYAVGRSLFQDETLGLATVAVYVFTGPIWYYALLSSGLYANFLGNLISLTLLYMIMSFVDERHPAFYLMIPLISLASYMTHYTVALLVFSLTVFVVAVWLFEGIKAKSYSLSLVLIILPAIPIITSRFDLFKNVLTFPTAQAGVFNYDPTFYSDVLNSVSPFLLYLSIQLSSVWISVLLLMAGILGIVIKLRRYFSGNLDHGGDVPTVALQLGHKRSLWILFLLTWFFTVWASSPYNLMAWRFAYYSLLPLTFILAFVGYNAVLNGFSALSWFSAKFYAATRLRGISHRKFQGFRARKISALVLLTLMGLVYINPLAWPDPRPSHFLFVVDDVFFENDTKAHHDEQIAIYQSMRWIKENIPKEASFLAVSEGRFVFMDVIADREAPFIADANLPPNLAYNLTKVFGTEYVIVTRGLRPSLTSPSTLVDLLSSYKASKSFEEVYSNSSVSIFKVIK